MRKILVFLILSLSPLFVVFGNNNSSLSPSSEVKEILNSTDCFYVNFKEDSLLKITANDTGLRVAKANYNLQTKKIYVNDFEIIKYKDMSDAQFNSFFETLKIENKQLKTIEYKGLVYSRMEKDEEVVFEMMEANAKVFIDGLCTEYLDDSTRLRFVLFREDNQYKLKTYKKGGKATIRNVQIINRNVLKCDDYNISVNATRISFEPTKGKDSYTSIFDHRSKECLSKSKDKTQRINATVPMPESNIYFFYDFFEDYRIPSCDLYRDEYGYLCLETSGKKYIFISNALTEKSVCVPIEQYFEFTGDNLKDDPEAVKKYFGNYPQDFDLSKWRQAGINGALYYKNIKASSSLKEKNKTYGPDGTLTVYNPRCLSTNAYWVKDNIPWAEGKAGDGIGETIEMDLIPGAAHNDSGFYFVILNGYVDPLRPYLFKQNNRIKKALIETDTGFKKEVTFNDAVEFNSVYIEEKTRHIKLTILEVYKGTKYSDTCITAFDLYDYWWEK